MSIKKILHRTVKSILRDKASKRWAFLRKTPKSPLERARARILKARA